MAAQTMLITSDFTLDLYFTFVLCSHPCVILKLGDFGLPQNAAAGDEESIPDVITMVPVGQYSMATHRTSPIPLSCGVCGHQQDTGYR